MKPLPILHLIINRFFLLALIFSISICLTYGQIEPDAGTWKTWIIKSGKEFRLAPPPDKAATKAEIQTILTQQNKIDSAATAQIVYWSAGAPGYRWDEIADAFATFENGSRLSSLLHVAIYDATIATWDSKYAYNRIRPSKANTAVKNYIPIPQSPSYPCEYSVAAGAASTILAYLFPQKADSIYQLAQIPGKSRIMAGIQYPSDVKAGFELGQKVAEKIIERARIDKSDTVWKGEFTKASGKWYHQKPANPLRGNWKPWVLTSGSQFRPGPPPDCAKGMEELKAFKPGFRAQARAYYWASTNYWSDVTHKKIFEQGLQLNPPRAARIYALLYVGLHDATIAIFDAKYAYLALRPEQYDTTFVPLFIKSPPHPSYPSGHATASSTMATILSYLFPYDKKLFIDKAKESAESRFEGGIHFRIDNEVGVEMGKKIGGLVIQRAKEDGAEQLPKLVNK